MIERILDARGPPKRRFFKIQWKGYPLSKMEKESLLFRNHFVISWVQPRMRCDFYSCQVPDHDDHANITQPNDAASATHSIRENKI